MEADLDGLETESILEVTSLCSWLKENSRSPSLACARFGQKILKVPLSQVWCVLLHSEFDLFGVKSKSFLFVVVYIGSW